jgi:hypothetical protein|tara:strand:- start:952 stop:1215 length:264 start_codon:yes stop_codon:yes gene_type:complete
MKTLQIVLATLVVLVSSFNTSAPAEAGSDSLPEMVVYHDPNCCGKWMAYMREAGCVVRSEAASDMASFKRQAKPRFRPRCGHAIPMW